MIEQLVAMQKYEVYKDSGVEWLGKIPEHWDLTRLGTRFDERRQKVSDKDFHPLSVTKNGILPQLETAAKTNDGDNRKLVKKGDFVINSRSDRKGSSGISDRDGSVSLINIVLEPKDIHPQYCHYLLKSYKFIEEFYRMGHGIVADLWTTRYDEMKAVIMGVPPLPEQTDIAAFLDCKTAQIDQAVVIKQKQIALLKERKQILIQNAVTRGLNPDAPMRDSGVEWLGNIPAHWDIKKLKYIVRFVSGATPSKDRAEYWNGIIPWISPKDMKRLRIDSSIDFITDMAIKKSNIRLLDIGTILIVVRGMILAKKIPVALSKVPLTINQDMKGLVPAPMCFPEYLLYLLDGINGPMSTLLEESGHGTKTLPTEKLGQLTLGIPPKHEQIAIVAHIETESAKIDQAISIQQQQIDKLKEYKATLINSAVTGKIRVSTPVEGKEFV